MENIVRTIYGAKLQTHQLLGLPITVSDNSTLNEKFNVNNDITMASNEMPVVKYVGIGNGGHSLKLGTNNIPLYVPVIHTARDAALYNQLPFVLRLPSDDLSASERSKYRLRRLETHNGTQYVAYYLKVLDMSETSPKLEFREVADGVTTTTEFQASIGDLSPMPPAVSNTGVNVTTGDYIAVTAKVPFQMDENDIEEYRNVCTIIYGSDDYAMISEIAICSGVDRTVTGNINGISTGYTDAIGVQICTFVNSVYAVKYTNGYIKLALDLGSVEPLLATTTV